MFSFERGWFSKCHLAVPVVSMVLVVSSVKNEPPPSQTQKQGGKTVSESTVSNTELSEFSGSHRAPGSKLSEFLSAYYLCAIANSPSFLQNSPSLPQNSVRLSDSLLQHSTLETVFCPFPTNSPSSTPGSATSAYASWLLTMSPKRIKRNHAGS